MGTGMQTILEAYTWLLSGIFIAYAVIDILTGGVQTQPTNRKDK
jgi:hypothetical protein